MKCQACTLMQLPRVTWTCTPAAQKLRAQQLHLVHGAERLPQHAPLALVLAGAHAVPLEGRVGLGPASSSAQAVPMRGAGGAWACTQQRAGCANGRRGRGLGLHPAAHGSCRWPSRAAVELKVPLAPFMLPPPQTTHVKLLMVTENAMKKPCASVHSRCSQAMVSAMPSTSSSVSPAGDKGGGVAGRQPGSVFPTLDHLFRLQAKGAAPREQPQGGGQAGGQRCPQCTTRGRPPVLDAWQGTGGTCAPPPPALSPGSPIMKYNLHCFQPRCHASLTPFSSSSLVKPLLMMSRMRCVPARHCIDGVAHAHA